MLSNIHASVKDSLESFGHKHTHLMAAFCLYGAYTVGSTALNWSWRFFKTFLRPGKNLFKRYHGGYIVITGGTDGLGLGYAKEFAAKGFNLVLIARNPVKLASVKVELTREHEGIDVKVIEFDFDKPYTSEGYKPLKEELDKIGDISILINNVGTLDTGNFNDLSINIINSMIQVNCIPQIVLTKYLLPRLLQRSKEQKKRTAILNISSASNYIRLAGSSIYASTKPFNKTFSDVIGKEYGKYIKGITHFRFLLRIIKLVSLYYIDVMAVIPGPTVSNLVSDNAPLVIQPDLHARWVLSDLGYNTETFGHYKHWMFTNIFGLPLLGAQFAKMRKSFVKPQNKN